MTLKVLSCPNGQAMVFDTDGKQVPKYQDKIEETLKLLKQDRVPYELYEMIDGNWLRVRNGDRMGWWRYHDHYDRDGYCDNPARGY